jgi:hypothetical protein
MAYYVLPEGTGQYVGMPHRADNATLVAGVWIEAWTGLSISTDWQRARHGPGQPGGNMATTLTRAKRLPIVPPYGARCGDGQ